LDGKAWLDALLGDDLVIVRARVRPGDVVYVKGVLEASEGLGAVFAEPRSASAKSSSRDGGTIVIAGPRSRLVELQETIRDLRDELDVLELATSSPRDLALREPIL
jgi:hypothetical protein